MLNYRLVRFSVIILLYITELNRCSRIKKKLKEFHEVIKAYITEKTTEIITVTFDNDKPGKKQGTPVYKIEKLVSKKRDRAKHFKRGPTGKVYPTMYPPKPPTIYTNPMVYPKVYLRFLIRGGFLLNFTDCTEFENIHDSYLLTGKIYNRKTKEVRGTFTNGEFYRSCGIWVYIRPDFCLREWDTFTGKMFYQFCTFEDDWRNFKYINYTDNFKIDVEKDNETLALLANYYFKDKL